MGSDLLVVKVLRQRHIILSVKSTESLINEETILIRRVSDIHGYKSDLRTLFFYSFSFPNR